MASSFIYVVLESGRYRFFVIISGLHSISYWTGLLSLLSFSKYCNIQLPFSLVLLKKIFVQLKIWNC